MLAAADVAEVDASFAPDEEAAALLVLVPALALRLASVLR